MTTPIATIRYGSSGTPLGSALVARTEAGICALLFLGDDDGGRALARLRADHPRADLAEDAALAESVLPRLWGFLTGEDDCGDLPLDMRRGTPFQRRVWEALRAIPRGQTRTYGEVAATVGLPRAARAVGAACGANAISLLVPCHRVVGSNGGLGGYYWGPDRKRALLDLERDGSPASISSPGRGSRRSGCRPAR